MQAFTCITCCSRGCPLCRHFITSLVKLCWHAFKFGDHLSECVMMGASSYLAPIRWLVNVSHPQEIHQNFLLLVWLNAFHAFSFIETREQSLNACFPRVVCQLSAFRSHVMRSVFYDRLSSIMIFRWTFIHLLKPGTPSACELLCWGQPASWLVIPQLSIYCWVGSFLPLV